MDFTATAVSVVSRAIGENLFDGSPLWVHHDIEDYKDRKFAPQYYD
jgi:hypothetical protein